MGYIRVITHLLTFYFHMSIWDTLPIKGAPTNLPTKKSKKTPTSSTKGPLDWMAGLHLGEQMGVGKTPYLEDHPRKNGYVVNNHGDRKSPK